MDNLGKKTEGTKSARKLKMSPQLCINLGFNLGTQRLNAGGEGEIE